MKKMILTIFLVFFLASSAFAVADLTSSGALSIGGASTTNPVTIGLSPRVTARYFTTGNSVTTAQWYAIATVHPGGNVGYGTAQDVNNIYMIGYTTGSAVTEVTNVIPVSADPQATEVETGGVDGDGNPITETVAAQTWTALGWSLTAPN